MTTHRKIANQRSARWAVMEKFEIPDYDRPERNYLTRWRIIQTPVFALYLHRMDGPDARKTLHDHPWPFVSVIIRGGYIERRLDPRDMSVAPRTVKRVNVMPLRAAHAIRELLRTPTWTFLIVGRRVRTWGYWEPMWQTGKWEWTEFDKHLHAEEFDRALRQRASA